MFEGAVETDWAPHAQTTAAIFEVNRDRRKRSKPFSAAEFIPDLSGKRKKRKVPRTTATEQVRDLARSFGLLPKKKESRRAQRDSADGGRSDGSADDGVRGREDDAQR